MPGRDQRLVSSGVPIGIGQIYLERPTYQPGKCARDPDRSAEDPNMEPAGSAGMILVMPDKGDASFFQFFFQAFVRSESAMP